MKQQTKSFLAAATLCVGLLGGCSGANQSSTSAANATPNAADGNKIEVVCTTFPAYDWVREVVGDKSDAYEITYLMNNGVDLHSYQASVEDIAKISDADLFVYVGGESDDWAQDVVDTASNSNLHTVSMLGVMGDTAVEEEHVEGMEAHEHEHEHAESESGEAREHEHEHAEGEEIEYDEHVWLSLRDAQVLVDAISHELAAIDPDNAKAYEANASAYTNKLANLDKSYAKAVSEGAHDTLVFADRFPFRYLVDDYNLNYYAAFAGCSAETEASFETVAFLAKKIDELGLENVLVIENSDQKIAKTVVQNTQSKNQEILVMDSLQSTTDADVKAGKTYLGTMEENLSVLTSALGNK